MPDAIQQSTESNAPLTESDFKSSFDALKRAIDWDSPLTEVTLATELPFWLLTPAGSHTITHDDATVTVAVHHDFHEVQYGPTYHDSGLTVVFVGRPADGSAVPVNLGNAIAGLTDRAMRTVLTIATHVHADVMTGLTQPPPRYPTALKYLKTLAGAHLSFVNALVSGYRRAARDPFAHGISHSDVPLWYILHDGKAIRFSLMPYNDNDQYPSLSKGGHHAPFFLASADDVAKAVNAIPIPGEMEVHDAWSHFYSGRYEDAVRTIVTAIEVVLESKLKEEWVARDAASAQGRLDRTRNDFEARLNEYCHITGRKLPGPLISGIPYINGVRLREELTNTRMLRHSIVHEGERVDYRSRPLMLRVIETMSWLFDWFINRPDYVSRPSNTYAFLSSMSGGSTPLFPCTYGTDGIRVHKEWEWTPEQIGQMTQEVLLAAQLGEAIGSNRVDLDKFVAMAATYLGFEAVFTSKAPPVDSPFTHDRLALLHEHVLVKTYCCDIPGPVDEAFICQVAAHSVASWREGERFCHIICIANHQNGLPWQYRDGASVATSRAKEIASKCGIAIVASEDMARLALSVDRNGWNRHLIRQQLVTPGVQGRHPEHYQRIGIVRKFFPQKSVLSVTLDVGASVSKGDRISVRLRERFHEEVIGSLEVDRAPVDSAVGVSCGIQVGLSRPDVQTGAEVFVCRAFAGEQESAQSQAVHPICAILDCPGCEKPTVNVSIANEFDLENRHFRVYRCLECKVTQRFVGNPPLPSSCIALKEAQPA